MRHHGEQAVSEDLPVWMWINRTFALVFILEIALRVATEGISFFHWRNKGFGWNVFDSLIVGSSIAEEIAALAFSTRRTRLSSVRVVRVLRLVRALRVIRVLRFFRELRIMVSGIMNCGKSLLWASLLIAIMTYTFAVVFLQSGFAHLQDSDNVLVHGATPSSDCPYATAAECNILKNFDSLPGGMYTLFKAMSGGSSWGDVSDDLAEISPLVTFAFCVYVMLAVFVVLNVITGAGEFLSIQLSVCLTTKRLGFLTTYKGSRSGSGTPRSCSRSSTPITRAYFIGATSKGCSPTRGPRPVCRSSGSTSTSRAPRSSSPSSIPRALASSPRTPSQKRCTGSKVVREAWTCAVFTTPCAACTRASNLRIRGWTPWPV
ncbi:unnamed protein product [Prorocentrum cordatum]|uniref:Ion transport domain-containing protein n=1 Tax=Prorocentrum cordatum TaxID=2364126 RepID=A0ABN9SE90_9DINO|nr:unnamed protein product [Polarella glacialis]